MKQELCQGKVCKESHQPRKVSEWPVAAFVHRCGKCWKREYGPDSFKYQELVDKQNKLPKRVVFLESPHEATSSNI